MRQTNLYGTTAAAAILGLHRNTLAHAIRQGKLKAEAVVYRSRGPVGDRYQIRRDDLMRYLLGRGAEPAAVRRLFNSAEVVALVKTPAAVQQAVARLMPTIQCGSLFELGRLAEGRKIWAAVLDLPELGTAQTAEALREYHAQADRPELIALVGDDGVRSLPSPVPFDVLIGATTAPPAIAAAVLRLRDSTAARH